MTGVTPAAQRDRLARKHRQALARPQRTGRQSLRLSLLRRWGTRYRPQTPTALSPTPKRILVIRPDHLGDLLLSTPALSLLRERYPQAEITGLVGPWGTAVLAGNPSLNQLDTCPFPGFTRRKKGSPLAPYRLLRAEAERLRSRQFDLALILRFDHWWGAWLAAAAGIPHRVGYNIPEVAPFLTTPIPYVAGRHEVVQNAALVLAAARWPDEVGEQASHHLGGRWPLRFVVSAEEDRAAEQLLQAVSHRRLVALHPGSGSAVKRWRAEAWVALARQLVQAGDAQLLLTGSQGERDLIEPIRQALEADGGLPVAPLSLAGQTSLGTLAAIYRRCALVIGPDSGPLHLAVAMGTQTIHLYGPVDRRAFGPWGNPQRHRVVTSGWACIPCNRLDWPCASLGEHGCVRDITVEQVLHAATELLACD